MDTKFEELGQSLDKVSLNSDVFLSEATTSPQENRFTKFNFELTDEEIFSLQPLTLEEVEALYKQNQTSQRSYSQSVDEEIPVLVEQNPALFEQVDQSLEQAQSTPTERHNVVDEEIPVLVEQNPALSEQVDQSLEQVESTPTKQTSIVNEEIPVLVEQNPALSEQVDQSLEQAESTLTDTNCKELPCLDVDPAFSAELHIVSSPINCSENWKSDSLETLIGSFYNEDNSVLETPVGNPFSETSDELDLVLSDLGISEENNLTSEPVPNSQNSEVSEADVYSILEDPILDLLATQPKPSYNLVDKIASKKARRRCRRKHSFPQRIICRATI